MRDLVLTQILFIVGLAWIGVAGKLGPSHVALWLLGIVFFCIALAMVVIHLNTWRPLEGQFRGSRSGFRGLIPSKRPSAECCFG